MDGGARRAVAATTAALLLTAGLAACDGDASSGTATPRRTPSTTAGQPGKTATAEPTRGVGPRKGALRGADVLVFSKTTLTDDMVKRIRKVKGVRSVEPMSMAQVSIEDRALNLAAVDPATYRNYTPLRSAELQEEWDRVAAGQLAVVEDLRKRIPAKDGLLKLGSTRDAPRVPIGAYAAQVPTIDAVVSTEVGERLGMQPGNALLVATYPLRSPESVRKPIERIAGESASVQRLDAGAGLDITVQQTAYLVGSVGNAVGIYNYTVLPGGRLISPETSWVRSHISTQTVPILGSVTCNTLIFPQLRAALQEIVDLGLASEIHPKEYAGCYYPRFIAGTTTLSNHAFGLALDLNVPGNQRGTVGEMNRAVVAVFEKWGFTWGGRWKYTDPMHFEANSIVNPG